MTNQLPHADSGQQLDVPEGNSHGGHKLMMIACCIPMLAIVGVLVATGAAGPGLILYAAGCTAMMALMMRMMPGGNGR